MARASSAANTFWRGTGVQLGERLRLRLLQAGQELAGLSDGTGLTGPFTKMSGNADAIPPRGGGGAAPEQGSKVPRLG